MARRVHEREAGDGSDRPHPSSRHRSCLPHFHHLADNQPCAAPRGIAVDPFDVAVHRMPGDSQIPQLIPSFYRLHQCREGVRQKCVLQETRWDPCVFALSRTRIAGSEVTSSLEDFPERPPPRLVRERLSSAAQIDTGFVSLPAVDAPLRFFESHPRPHAQHPARLTRAATLPLDISWTSIHDGLLKH